MVIVKIFGEGIHFGMEGEGHLVAIAAAIVINTDGDWFSARKDHSGMFATHSAIIGDGN